VSEGARLFVLMQRLESAPKQRKAALVTVFRLLVLEKLSQREEMGGKLYDPGDMKSWDGLLHGFLDYSARRPEVVANLSIRQWHMAATRAVAENVPQTRVQK